MEDKKIKLKDFVLLISTSSDQLNEKSFLNELFNSKGQVLESRESSLSNIQLHPFKLDNKYYKTTIEFVSLVNQNDLDSNLIEQTEVLTIIFDTEQVNFKHLLSTNY